MSKHAKTATAASAFTLVHPHGLPCLQKPDGTIWTCDPDSEPINIGTYDKASTVLSLHADVDDRLAARIASWRAAQKPRARTERVTAYRAFMRKSKAAGSKQAASRTPGAGEADAPEDNQDEE
jgi:hypothetical protein